MQISLILPLPSWLLVVIFLVSISLTDFEILLLLGSRHNCQFGFRPYQVTVGLSSNFCALLLFTFATFSTVFMPCIRFENWSLCQNPKNHGDLAQFYWGHTNRIQILASKRSSVYCMLIFLHSLGACLPPIASLIAIDKQSISVHSFLFS